MLLLCLDKGTPLCPHHLCACAPGNAEGGGCRTVPRGRLLGHGLYRTSPMCSLGHPAPSRVQRLLPYVRVYVCVFVRKQASVRGRVRGGGAAPLSIYLYWPDTGSQLSTAGHLPFRSHPVLIAHVGSCASCTCACCTLHGRCARSFTLGRRHGPHGCTPVGWGIGPKSVHAATDWHICRLPALGTTARWGCYAGRRMKHGLHFLLAAG